MRTELQHGTATAWLLALAVLAGACTGGAAEPVTTGLFEGSDHASAMIGDALGGTQSVQDFLIHLDMVVSDGDVVVSVMDEVVERARSGMREKLDLNGGFQIGLVDSLAGWAAAADGARLESVSSHFGLLEMDPAASAEIEQRMTAGLPDFASSRISEAAFAGGEEPAFLVQIVTASYEDSWTHVGVDDTLAVDFSFLPSVVSATDVASVHLFGQTLPGDPTQEAGLTAHELFAFRWNQGLVRLVGDQSGPQFILTGGMVGGPATTSSLPSRARSLAASLRGDRGTVMGAAAGIGFAVEGELPGPDNDPGAPAGGDADVADPGVVRIVAKAFDRAVVMAAAFRAGEAKATELLRKATEELSTPEDGTAVHIRENPPHCIFRKGERLVVGTENRGGNFPGGCMAVFQMPLRAYPLMWAMKYELAACRWFTAMARIANRPSTGLTGVAVTTEAGSTSTTSDPLFPPPTTPELPPCELPKPRRSGGTVGDVHVVTFDQVSYGNQASGEFLMFDNGVATVQMRTEPWEKSDIATVATAVAVHVDGRNVSMHRAGLNRPGETWIDGEPIPLDRGVTVAVGDGALAWTGTSWVVVWPDGTRLTVDDGGNRLMFTVQPSGLPAIGMLGDGDGVPDNDLVTRDGAAVEAKGAVDPLRFYETYIDSWRITAEESLFRYGPGESTDGFQLADFPDHTILFEDVIDDGAGEAAEAACRDAGITRADRVAACVYDLVVTGDESFVDDHFVMQASLPDRPLAGPAPVGDGAGGGNSVVLGGLVVEFEAFGPSGWCTADDISLGAATTTSDGAGRRIDVSIQYVDGESPLLTLVVQADGTPVGWVNTAVSPPSGSVNDRVFGDGALQASGSAFLNEPVDPALSWNQPLPTGSRLVTFELEARCDG